MNLFVHLVNSWTNQPNYEATSTAAALAGFIEAPNWATSRQVIEQHPELLGDLAEAMLARAAEALDVRLPQRQSLLDHLTLLWHCRRKGIDAAFASLSSSSDDRGASRSDAHALVAAIHQFVFAPTRLVSRRVLDEHPGLLSDQAEFIMANAVRTLPPEASPACRQYMLEGLRLLRSCRQMGTDAAFAALGPR